MSAALIVRLVAWLWFAAALYAGRSLLLQRLPAPAIPALTLMIAALALMLTVRVASVRSWMAGVELRTLVLFHIVRLASVAFLFEHQRGNLPFAMAVPAGIGDIAI